MFPHLDPAPLTHSGASNPYRYGATVTGDGVDFVVWAPHATHVDVCLFQPLPLGQAPVSEKTESTEPQYLGSEIRVGMHGPDKGRFHVHVPGVGVGTRYGFRVHGPWEPERGLLHNPSKLLLDPYARAVTGSVVLGPEIFAHEVNAALAPQTYPLRRSNKDSAGYSRLGVVAGPGFPVVPGPVRDDSDVIIYETHVKGITQLLPGVPEHLRGTYAGLAHPVTISHLKALGITAVELLPIHAMCTEPWLMMHGRENYWGYSTLNFFSPEPTYATAQAQAQGPLAVLDEVRGMVSMLHEAGLEVIMDVVYNHTCESGTDGPTLSLRGFDNEGYYLHAPGAPNVDVDVTGTGNTVDFRSATAVQLALDSLRYWASDVGVDGFRFDLAVTLGRNASEFSSNHPLLIAMATDPILSSKRLIAEPWDVGPGGWRTGEFPSPFQDWNDRYRGSVRSFWLQDASQIARGRCGNTFQDMATRLCGSQDVFGQGALPGGRGPLASINFITAHDGFTLRDLTCFDHKHNMANGEDNRDGSDDNRSWNHGFEGEVPQGIDAEPVELLRRRNARNMMATLLISTGTPMMLGGDEMGRTQQGNNNSYCQDNEISWYDWDLKSWQRDMLATTRLLTHLRHKHPVLRPTQFATGQVAEGDVLPDVSWYSSSGTVMRPDEWNDPTTRVIQMMRSGQPMGDGDALIVINGALDQVDVTLPKGRGLEYRLLWDSTWAAPRRDTREFATMHRVDDDTEVRRDRGGDVTTIDALSMRIYLSTPPDVH
ncbi:glycogen debranching protein GlgX [Actinomyces vulturis]|uniref:glycogen debranching protein GlgX n=1 Tax=Actinomyces vulturis TaxID=1857645 RepID=UPI000834E41D|nr:glycogen debranching protein GlgX [Actinomyces vulturis]